MKRYNLKQLICKWVIGPYILKHIHQRHRIDHHCFNILLSMKTVVFYSALEHEIVQGEVILTERGTTD